MSSSPYIERYGNLLKQETLQILDDQVLPNTFVLEAPEPFPGFSEYYSEHPDDVRPLYIYFVVKQLYTLEEVTRATQNIRKYFQSDFNAAAGVVNIYNKEFNVIRVRHLQGFDQIPELQSCYIDEGIEFRKKPGGKMGGPAVIRIKKFFILEEKHPGVYFDVTEKDHGYFSIPKQLTWKYFEDLTRKVKFNWDQLAFDAAVGHFHVNYGIQDMIRIYNPKLDLESLMEVRKLYFDRIK
ncbi:hypothetical protein ACT3CD_14220 [Geofilum sp. OHC36d9]|uniref:hypothetical protein n=1 Tax=Geofilum sp. OHC36d9 TaxID=3458413 RepID=UPI0040343B92